MTRAEGQPRNLLRKIGERAVGLVKTLAPHAEGSVTAHTQYTIDHATDPDLAKLEPHKRHHSPAENIRRIAAELHGDHAHDNI